MRFPKSIDSLASKIPIYTVVAAFRQHVMDEVPELFVDAVIGLFTAGWPYGVRPSLDPLDSIIEFDHSIWSSIGKLHIDNRRYFFMDVGKVDGDFAFGFGEYTRNGNILQERIKPSDLKLLKPQYSRIQNVSGTLGSVRKFRDVGVWGEDLLRIRESQIQAFLSQFANNFANGNMQGLRLVRKSSYLSDDEGVLSWEEFSDFSRLILRAFYKRAYFSSLTIPYVGSESEDFLKDHIYNHPRLSDISLEEDWPSSILQDVKHFIRKGKGRRVSLPAKFPVDGEFITELFELWRRDGEFECTLWHEPQGELPPFLDTMTLSCMYERLFYLKNEIQKSIAIYDVKDFSTRLAFEKCSCDVSVTLCSFHRL